MSLLLAVALAAATAAADVTVTAKPSATEVTVGEPFAVEVSCVGPAGVVCDFPGELADEKIELRVRAVARPEPDRRTYDASVFALGEAAIPPITVSCRLPDGTTGQVRSAPVPLQVRSLLSRDPKEQQLADIRPPVSLSVGTAFYVALGIVLLVLAGLGYWLWRRRRRRAVVAAPQAPPVPPGERALAALVHLAASGHIEREEFRPFYIELTEIAKRYLEARLEAPIVEMTSMETVAFLRQHPRGASLADTVRAVSGAADQVKFARGQGARELAEGHLGAVQRMVTQLEDSLRPAPPDVAGTAKADR
jgi:hypothetical protein